MAKRPETGPMQFGDDWPGVFIRGDSAFAFATAVRQVLMDVPKEVPGVILHGMLKGLLQTLESCIVTNERKPKVTKARLEE